MTDSIQLFPPFAEEMLPGGGHRSFVLKRGQLLRLTDLRGGANVSLTLLNANEKTERLNLPDSLKCQHTAKLTSGHCLYSDMGRVLAAITADTCGWSDSIGGVLCACEVAEKYGQGRYQELRNGFYVYSYLDSNDQGDRLFDSWSRWTFNESLGGLMGVIADDSGLLALTLRVSHDGMPIIALDRFVRETAPSRIPYFDSYEKYPSVMHRPTAFAAYGADSERYLIGAPLKDIGPMIAKWPTETQHLYIGAGYDSLVDLTSPYIRDKDDKIILDARVSVTKLTVSVSNSVAISAQLSYDLGKTWKVGREWIDRPAGGWQLGVQSIAEEHSLSVPVMKENKAYRARISSRNWLPLTISVVEWSGQAFTSR